MENKTSQRIVAATAVVLAIAVLVLALGAVRSSTEPRHEFEVNLVRPASDYSIVVDAESGYSVVTTRSDGNIVIDFLRGDKRAGGALLIAKPEEEEETDDTPGGRDN